MPPYQLAIKGAIINADAGEGHGEKLAHSSIIKEH
jgi:hypothetical protein